MEPEKARDPVGVRRMFDGIAARYDLLNHVLSANLDRRWRRAAAAEVGTDLAGPVLDLCGGTGDLTLALSNRTGAPLICCDFAHAMLTRAATKFRRRGVADRCYVLEADALRLPFADDRFAAVTVAFGVRNLADLDAGLREIHRVVAPGGKLVVLEFSSPGDGPLGRIYRFYLHRLLPRVGDRVAGRSGPYRYLARTIGEFPDAETLAGRIRAGGFAACGWRHLNWGIVALHTAFKA